MPTHSNGFLQQLRTLATGYRASAVLALLVLLCLGGSAVTGHAAFTLPVVLGLPATLVASARWRREVDELRLRTGELSYQASHDELTGLLNRREFNRRIVRACEETGWVLLYVDLDQFKVVNDRCGHASGDDVLRRVAGLLTAVSLPYGAAARLGGDEFGVILRCSREGGVEIAERLRTSLTRIRCGAGDQSFHITASIGVVALEGDDWRLDRALGAVDLACYSAKDKGRNRVELLTGEEPHLGRRDPASEWGPRIERALEEGRMRLDYQPIMRARPDVSDVPRYEVLLRMLDDDGSVILPGAFIPDAEREGLAPTLDRWVIDAALAYLADGHGAADEARELCSVNISGASLDDPGLADDIRDMLERHGVPPAALCLEITETAAIASLATARHFIERLRALGCSFALDDFGSGLSSFAYLKALPVDYVKIDGAFVTDMADDPSCVVMVRAISEVATGVGARTIAEFVEDERTIEWLRSLGVEYVQGYAVGHPSPLAGRERPLVKPTMAAL